MTVWCQWFDVYMGFSDKDRILVANLYFLKSYKANRKLLRNFWIKVGDYKNWTNFWKSCKKLAWWLD